MSLVINTNSVATTTRNYLNTNQANLQRSLGRLASGSRIVKPSDDAGGLAVGNKLTAAQNRNTRAQQNVQNAVSFLQVQDGALSSAGKILDRMSELKTMSLDVTKNSTDIANYDAEFNQLQDQLANIREEKFNGINLFTAGKNDLSVYTVENGDGLIDSTSVQTEKVTVNVDATNSASASAYSVMVNGTAYSVTPTAGDTAATVAGALEDAVTAAGLTGITATDNTDGTFTVTGTAGTNFSISVSTGDATGGINVENTSGKVTVGISREGVFRQDTNGKGLVTTGGLDLTDSATAASNNLSDYTVDDFVNFIQEAATSRATNGAQMSRLEQSSALLTTNQANIESARSRLMDVDIATESTQFAKHNILVQSSAAMLAQANSVSNVALQLLG